MNEQEPVRLSQMQFLSLLSHELRAPLHSIQGYLDLALMGVGGELNAQQHEFMQRARVASQHLYALLEDLLCIARADSEQLHLQRTITDLPDLIENAVEELALTATDQGIALHVHIEQQLPRLYADAVRIQQVLRNLIHNAIRFTPEGGTVEITASVVRGVVLPESTYYSETEDEVAALACLRVRDTGIGIAPEFHERIFERFYRVLDKKADRGGGPGLGLWIVKLLLELHGGRVSVESVPGKGSVFTCLLPGLLL